MMWCMIIASRTVFQKFTTDSKVNTMHCIIMKLFNLSKINWARMKILDLDIRIARKIRHNTKRNRMTIDGVFVNKHHGLTREPWRKRNNGFDRNRFKTLIKGWIDEQAKINGKVHIRFKATNYKRPSQIKLFKKKVEKKYYSDSKDDRVPNSENNKPQLVLVHHLRF